MEYKNYDNEIVSKKIDLILKEKSKLPKVYKILLKENFLRRKYNLKLSMEQLEEEINCFCNNVNEIAIKNIEALGVFIPNEKKIIISKEKIKQLRQTSTTDKIAQFILETLLHESNHAIKSTDMECGLSFYCPEEQIYKGIALDEVVTELSSTRLFKNITEKEILNGSIKSQGYNMVIFFADIVAATFGVTEQEFLQYASKGREKMYELLDEKIRK